jgi:heat shock protein HslJ
VEGALSAGLSVGLVTVAGGEAPIRSVLDGMRGRVQLVHQPAQASIRFEHHGAHDRRRLRLVARTAPVALARLAGIPTPLSSLDPDLAAALRGLDLLVASERDIGAPDGPSALAALRAWSGPGPELVITAGVHGAWLDSGREPVAHVPAQVVEGRHTIGAGDAFGAVLAARRATGAPLVEAASAAAAATAAYLAGRPTPVGTDGSAPARHHDLGVLEGTAWRAVRFGPGLGETPPGDAEFSLDVAEGRLSGKSGCNRYMGGWTLTDGALGIGPLAGTLMYCTEPLMRLERVYLDAVQGTAGFAVAQDVLTFFGAGGQPLVEFVRAPSEGAPEP